MERKQVIKVGLAVLLVLLVVGSAAVSAASILASEIDRHVIAGGGGRSEAGRYVLNATIGQPVAGRVSNSPYDLCGGFWCGAARYQIYLPLILRN